MKKNSLKNIKKFAVTITMCCCLSAAGSTPAHALLIPMPFDKIFDSGNSEEEILIDPCHEITWRLLKKKFDIAPLNEQIIKKLLRYSIYL